MSELDKEFNYRHAQIDRPLIDLKQFSTVKIKGKAEKIISIVELCKNKKLYNYTCSNKTFKFWSNVIQEEHLSKIFVGYEAETLRKFWFLIRKANDLDEFSVVLMMNRKQINNSDKCLLAIINCVTEYVNNNIEGSFSAFFERFFSDRGKERKENIII